MTDTVPLREFFELRVQLAEARCEAAESRFNLQFASGKAEVELARVNLTTRLDANNGHVELLKTQQALSVVAIEKLGGTLASKDYVQNIETTINNRLRDLGISRDRDDGRSVGMSDATKILFSVLAFLVGVGGIIAAVLSR